MHFHLFTFSKIEMYMSTFEVSLVPFFSLEYAGELRIIVLRRRMIQLQNPHLTLDQNEERGELGTRLLQKLS